MMNHEILTWKEIVQKYPDMYVFVQNYVADGPNIRSGEVIEAVRPEDFDEADIRWYTSGADYMHSYTGEDSSCAVLWF